VHRQGLGSVDSIARHGCFAGKYRPGDGDRDRDGGDGFAGFEQTFAEDGSSGSPLASAVIGEVEGSDRIHGALYGRDSDEDPRLDGLDEDVDGLTEIVLALLREGGLFLAGTSLGLATAALRNAMHGPRLATQAGRAGALVSERIPGLLAVSFEQALLCG